MTATEAVLSIALSLANLHLVPASLALPWRNAQGQETSQSAAAKRIGAIKTIDGNTITLTPDSGADVSVMVQATTRIVRIAPGEKNLKNATPIQLQELQVGDRILVGGKASEDGKSLAASSIVVMKISDVEAHKEQERQDWQKRGIGGMVSAVDVPAGTVTVSIAGLGGTKAILVHASKDTVVRRYAPDSVKFDDAKPSTLQEIHPGDQLRARGNRSTDGADLTAEEIVSGSFRNVAGIVNSADASAGTISVQDVSTKKTVQVKVTADSQLHKLPPELAQRIAMRLKGKAAGQSSNGATSSASSPGQGANGGGPTVTAMGTGMGGGMRSGGTPDFQQMLSRTPSVSLADLHKGDAVMILATQGTGSGGSTAITLLSGVEPILEAAPNGSQDMMLASWNLGGPSGDAGNQ